MSRVEIQMFKGQLYETNLLSQETSIMDGGQVSVVDLDELVQVLCFLHLVLKL